MLTTDVPVELYPMAFVVAAGVVGASFGESHKPILAIPSFEDDSSTPLV